MLFFLALFIFYLATLSNTVYGGDAGDLVSAIMTHGVPHPPGYPLYTVLGIIFTWLPLPLSPAGKVTLISTLATTASLGVLYITLKELFPKSFSRALAFIATAIVGANYLIWLYAIVPEVFPLNTLTVMLLFLCGLRYYRTTKTQYLYWIALLTGLGISHHHTFVLILPSVFLLLYQKRKKVLTAKIILSAGGVFLAGLLPYLYAVLIPFANPSILWADSKTPTGFIELILRKGYGTFVAGQFISDIWIHRFVQLMNLLFHLLSDFSFAGVILILLGCISIWKTPQLNRLTKWAIFLALFLFGPFFTFYANFPLRFVFEFATVERFFLAFYMLLGIPLYAGLVLVYEKLSWLLKKNIANKKLLKRTLQGVIIILALLPLAIAAKSAKVILPLHNDQTAEHFGEDTLRSMKPHSLLILTGDNFVFNTQYVYYENRAKYPDRYLIHASKLIMPFYVKQLQRSVPGIYASDKMSLSDFMKKNAEHFTIYANDIYPLSALKEYTWISVGLVQQLVKKDTVDYEQQSQLLINYWKNQHMPELVADINNNPGKWRNNFTSSLLSSYATAYLNTAYFLSQHGHTKEALPFAQKASILNPTDPDNHYLIALIYQISGDCRKSEDELSASFAIKQDELYIQELKQLAANCYKTDADKKKATAHAADWELQLKTPLDRNGQ